jgi:hypothetical protein
MKLKKLQPMKLKTTYHRYVEAKKKHKKNIVISFVFTKTAILEKESKNHSSKTSILATAAQVFPSNLSISMSLEPV